ncbi:histamine H2 receptor-like [Montipora foliosa]|uniref:histamine H2 receptor-like n=1 Tax=Montipora foliosa TaxID=591990 RepID=UPI0035F11694
MEVTFKNSTGPSPNIVPQCHLLPVGHIFGMMAVNILSTVAGTVGNLLVIGTVPLNFNLQTISNFWLVSMAVADLFVTALGQPLFSVFLGLQLGGECYHVVSQAFRLIANMSCSASVLHLCFISVDRCLVILRPHDFRTIRTKKRFRMALAFSWTLPVVYGILRLTVSKKATSYFTVLAVGLCYITIILCYALIILKVRKQGSTSMKRRRRNSTERRVALEHIVERRVTVTIAIVVVIFTVCWVPLLYLRSAFAEANFGLFYNWARTLALSNSSMNPWIYCFRISEFRKAYNKLLRCQWKPASNNGTSKSSQQTGNSSELETTQQTPDVV